MVEERLEVEKQLVELGEVLFHKTVEQFEEVTSLPLSREELEIVRGPVDNEPLDKPLEIQYEEEWLVIPVMQEIVVVKKLLVLTEKIRIRKHQVVQQQEIREQVRRERVEVEDRTTSTS